MKVNQPTNKFTENKVRTKLNTIQSIHYFESLYLKHFHAFKGTVVTLCVFPMKNDCYD